MSDNTGYVCLAVTAVTGLVVLVGIIVGSITYYNTTTYKALIEGGYTQEIVPGSSQPIWIKKGINYAGSK